MDQLMQMMSAMQHKISGLEEARENDKVIMSQFETEMSSLRMSMVKVAANPEQIRTILQRVARGFLGRQRCKRIRRAAATNIQRLARACRVRRVMTARGASATKIQSVWRGVPERKRLFFALQAIRPLQRVARGWLTRQHLARQHQSADVIARSFHYHTSHLRQQYVGIHQALQKERVEKQQLESDKDLLLLKLAQFEQQFETQRRQKEKWQDKANTLVEATKCPISHAPMKRPVLCIADGQQYEKSAIVEWVARSGTSPVTRCPVGLRDLVGASPAALRTYFKTQQWLSHARPTNVYHLIDYGYTFAHTEGKEMHVFSDVLQIEDLNPRHCYSFKILVKKEKERPTPGFYISLQPGASPETLEWPMCRTMVLTVVNHANTSKHATNALDPVQHAGFKKHLQENAPPASTNTAAYGCPEMISKDQVASGDFLSKEGAMTFVVELKPQ
jgi:hypothetical protein